MSNLNFNTDSNEIPSELLAALIAKLMIGNPDQVDDLNKLLATLPTDKSSFITQLLMKYDAKTDLNNLAHGQSGVKDAKDRFTLHKASEALLPQPPIDWMVNSLLSPGTVSIVFGDPGSKKTYSMLDLAVCVSQGKSWLGFETKKTAVLIIDEESGIRRLNRRLGDVMGGHDAKADIPIYSLSLAGFNFNPNNPDGLKDLATLEEKIRETGAKFIIIDALADVMLGVDENSVRDVQPVFISLRQIADRTGAAILIIHHANKSGGYRGSSAIFGALDLLLKVESDIDSPNINFKVEKNRDGMPTNFSAVASFETRNSFLTSSQFVKKQPVTEPEKYVLQYLSKNGTSFVSDIMSHADICKDTTARQAVYSLSSRSLISRVDSGGLGEKAKYDLTVAGKEMAQASI